MIVECPVCRTRYRTDGAGIIDENTFFECSQENCQHVFSYTPPLLQGGSREVPISAPPPLTSLSENTLALVDEAPQEKPPPSLAPMGQAPSTRPLDEEDFSPPETPFFTEREGENNGLVVLPRPESEPATEMIFSLRPFLLLLGLIILGYAALGFYCLSNLAQTEAVLAQLPLLNAVFAAERFSAQQIALLDLKGSFWLTKDGRRVFAVSGKAVNDAPVPARSIQVEGAIYGAGGKVLGQRVIFCGTETATTVLESLTVREIGILQNLVPPKQFHVPAGQSVNFLIVFTNPPPAIAEFSSRVVAAQFG